MYTSGFNSGSAGFAADLYSYSVQNMIPTGPNGTATLEVPCCLEAGHYQLTCMSKPTTPFWNTAQILDPTLNTSMAWHHLYRNGTLGESVGGNGWHGNSISFGAGVGWISPHFCANFTRGFAASYNFTVPPSSLPTDNQGFSAEQEIECASNSVSLRSLPVGAGWRISTVHNSTVCEGEAPDTDQKVDCCLGNQTSQVGDATYLLRCTAPALDESKCDGVTSLGLLITAIEIVLVLGPLCMMVHLLRHADAQEQSESTGSEAPQLSPTTPTEAQASSASDTIHEVNPLDQVRE
eukprot:COSAG01_NODE_53_length_31352_cov_23.122452_9_plen_293_part_00